jgi:hypothetical protein
MILISMALPGSRFSDVEAPSNPLEGVTRGGRKKFRGFCSGREAPLLGQPGVLKDIDTFDASLVVTDPDA